MLFLGTEIYDPVTGCRGCASGSNHNIFGNKYGQYLAVIQVAREERVAKKAEERARREREAQEDNAEDEDEEDDESAKAESESEDDGPVTEADGKRKKKQNFWVTEELENTVELTDDMIGHLAGEAKHEAVKAAAKAGGKQSETEDLPPNKRTRTSS
jgi:hypothetical protein